MSSNLDLRTNRITTQTISSNFFQGSNADIANITCDYETVNKNLIVFGNETVNGQVIFTNTTDGGCTGSAYAVSIAGGVKVAGSLGVSGPINCAYMRFNPTVGNYYIGNTGLGIVGGTGNIGFGTNVLAGSTGSNNVAIGFNALTGTTGSTGNNNIAIGTSALNGNTGSDNIAIGFRALASGNGSDTPNIAIGSYALENINASSGRANIAIGHQALNGNQAGENNIAIGYQSLLNADDGENVGVGNYTLVSANGYNNTALGMDAGANITDANDNTFVGNQSGYYLQNGNQNTFVGSVAGVSGTTGNNNVGIGYYAGNKFTGDNNTFIGTFAGGTGSGSTGTNVTCIGYNALPSSTSVSNEMTLGNTGLNLVRTYGVIQTLNTTDIAGCTGTTGALIVTGGAAINGGLYVGRTGCFNNGLGVTGGDVNINGNLGVTGTTTLRGAVGITGNVDINGNLGVTGTINNAYMNFNNTTSYNYTINNVNGISGSNNTFFGYYTGATATGSNNTFYGSNAGLIATTGSNNTFIGYNAGVNATTGSNLTCIGYNAQASSGVTGNEITLGDTNITNLRCYGGLTNPSDRRDKTDIENLPVGLDVLNQIQPRRFKWDRRDWYENGVSDGSKKAYNWTSGFIAQEFDEVQQNNNAEYLNLVYKPNPEKIEITPNNLLPVIVKAIQDLSNENKQLKERVETLENKINSLNL